MSLPVSSCLWRARILAPLLVVVSFSSNAQTPAGSAGSGAAVSGGPEPSFAEANRLVQSGRLAEASTQLEALAARQPEPGGVERLRGTVLYLHGDLAGADVAFAKALAQDPNDKEAAQLRGVTLFREGKASEAVPLLEASRAVSGNVNVDGNYVLGLCYMDTRRYDDARRAFAAQYGFAPESAEAYLLAGRLLFRREYLPAAVASAGKAAALAPKMPMVHELLGEIALAQSREADAVTEFAQESALNPLYSGAYYHLGDAYVRTGAYDKAQATLNRAILLDPASTGPYILLGKALLKQHNPAMATMYLERARNMDPNNFMTHSLLAQAYRAAGRTEDAARETEKSIELQASTAPKLAKP